MYYLRCSTTLHSRMSKAMNAWMGRPIVRTKVAIDIEDWDVLSEMYDHTASLFQTPCILIEESETLESYANVAPERRKL